MKKNAYAGLIDTQGLGVDAIFGNAGSQYSLVYLDQIEIKAQIRESFEDEENSLSDLAASIKARGVLQPVLLRTTPTGYELIAGERRYRASKMAGLEQIPAYIKEMTDEEAEDAQLAENIHRKNLTQIEEAKKIQRDLDQLGSVKAVLEKHHKSHAWLSKTLALLHLPEQAKRLVTENVSADIEVINTVKTIEKADPEAAKDLVDELKETRGKENARDKAAAVKGKVKPSKSRKKSAQAKGSTVATTKDRSHEMPAEVGIFAGAKTENERRGLDLLPGSSFDVLDNAYINIFGHGKSPQAVLDEISEADKENVKGWLHGFYETGNQADDVGKVVMRGFREGFFSTAGYGAFALVAFLYGVDSEAKFELLNIFGSVNDCEN